MTSPEPITFQQILMERIASRLGDAVKARELYDHCLAVARSKVFVDPESEIGPGDFVQSRYDQLYHHGREEARARLTVQLSTGTESEKIRQGRIDMLANDIGAACAETEMQQAAPSWERIRLENLRDESEEATPNPIK